MNALRALAAWCAPPRRWAPGTVGLLAVGALVLLGDDAAPVKAAPAPVERVAAALPPAPPASALALERLRREAPPREVADLFVGHSWTPRPALPAPPPVAASAAAAEPSGPPPLPFAYVGRFDEDGRRTVYYLERGAAVFTVGAGDAIDAEYRLDAGAAGELTITHAPSQTRYVLRIPE